MATTFSESGKGADEITGAMQHVLGGIEKNARVFFAAIALLLVLGGVGAYLANQRSAKSDQARSVLFLAQRELDTAMRKLAPPPTAKGEKQEAENALQNLTYKRLDVDAQFPEAVKKLKAVIDEYPGTRASMEAALSLANLYYQHGQAEKSLPWYQQVAEHASDRTAKAFGYAGLGYGLENASKPKEALDAFQKALNQGEASLKGDLLMAIARCQEALHDIANARSTYDQVLTQLPNSEFSKSAALFKAQLE